MAKYLYLSLFGVSMTFIVFFIGVAAFKKLTAEMKAFVILIGLGAVTESAILFFLFRGKAIQWPHNIYMPFHYALFSYIFFHWQKSIVVRKLILASIPIYIIISTYSTVHYYHFYNFDNFSLTLALVLLVIISSYTLFNIQKSDAGGIMKDYRFWVLSGILISSAGNLVYFALNDLVIKYYVFTLYVLHLFWNISAYILYIIGIARQYRERKLCGA